MGFMDERGADGHGEGSGRRLNHEPDLSIRRLQARRQRAPLRVPGLQAPVANEGFGELVGERRATVAASGRVKGSKGVLELALTPILTG